MTDPRNGPRLSIIPAWVISNPDLKGKDLAVLCMLGSNTNTRHGWCRRSQVKLAEALSCSRSTVQAAIDRLVDMGAVERQKVESASGRDSAHWYRVVYDRVVASDAFTAWEVEDDKEYGPNEAGEFATPPAGIPAPPADPRPAPPAGSGPAPINDYPLTPPDQRSHTARAREEDEEDFPSLFQRVRRMELGGKTSIKWPGCSEQSTDWATHRFKELSPADRKIAEERRDLYLHSCRKDRDGVPKTVSLGHYLRDRKFETVLPPVSSGGVAKTLAPAWGPAWGAICMEKLLAGPVDLAAPDDAREAKIIAFEGMVRLRGMEKAREFFGRQGFDFANDGSLIFPPDFDQRQWREHVRANGYPAVNQLYAMAERSQSLTGADAERGQSLVPMMEFVVIDTPLYREWQEYFERCDWQFPKANHRRGLYFPAGGPENLQEFTRGIRDDDAA